MAAGGFTGHKGRPPMKFYLGTHRPYWLWKVEVPLFISRRTLSKVVKRTPAVTTWALDSGGFTELSIHGKWTINAERYAEEIEDYRKIGGLKWAAPQDWMCEPWILEKTGLSVLEHQNRTVQNYLELKKLNAPVIPVLQGWELEDYEQCAKLYEQNGIKLEECDVVGLGSVCRRQATDEIGQLAKWGHNKGLNLHGFGVKSAGLKKYAHYLTSADSLAWSFTGRYHADPQCTKKTCANCLHFALTWREKTIKDVLR